MAALVLAAALTGPALASDTARPASGAAPAVSIVIDDMGYLRRQGLRALELRGEVTYSFLPHTPYAARLATLAHQLGKEVMLHLPMEADIHRRLGPGGLTRMMSQRDFGATLRGNLAAVPYVRGVNNHMGSLLTREPQQMEWLMSLLRDRGGLYFLDSRTTDHSVAGQMAGHAGVPWTSRDVFLDNDRDTVAIQRQFDLLIARARRVGTALGIAHPHDETLAVLERALDSLESDGVRLVAVSRLVERRGWGDR